MNDDNGDDGIIHLQKDRKHDMTWPEICLPGLRPQQPLFVEGGVGVVCPVEIHAHPDQMMSQVSEE